MLAVIIAGAISVVIAAAFLGRELHKSDQRIAAEKLNELGE